MSKKISFSSVLRDKGGFQNNISLPSLAELAQQYVYNPNGNYILRLAAQKNNSRIKTNIARHNEIDFEEGCNPLEQWINNQSSNSNNFYSSSSINKQNKNSQLTRIPQSQTNLKIGRPKSPIKNHGSRNQFTDISQENSNKQYNTNSRLSQKGKIRNNKNLSMNELSRMYVVNKNSNISEQFSQDQCQEPVWKFTPSHQQQEYGGSGINDRIGLQSNISNNNKESNEEDDERVWPQNINQKKFLGQNKNHNEAQGLKRRQIQTMKPYQQSIQNKQPKNKYFQEEKSQQKDRKNDKQSDDDQNLGLLIDKIKDNLCGEIQAMAERIIKDRSTSSDDKPSNSYKDEELLISQRQSESQKQKKRLQRAREEISEYLKIKNNHMNKQINTNEQQIKRKSPQAQPKAEIPEQNGVGYSFASQFNSNIQVNEQSKEQSPKVTKTNTQIYPQMIKPQKTSHQKQFCLPNIDEVRSQHDCTQNRVFEEYHQNQHPTHNQIEIDTKYIKQIQSVAYRQSPNHVYQNTEKPVFIPVASEAKENTEKQYEGRPSLNQKVDKLSMSMSMANAEDNGVITSVASERHEQIVVKEADSIIKEEKTQINVPNVGTTKQNYIPIYSDNLQDTVKQQEAPKISSIQSIKRIQTIHNLSNKRQSPKPQAHEAGQPPAQFSAKRYQASYKLGSSSGHGGNQNSGQSQNKRLLKITLSPKYQKVEQQQNHENISAFMAQQKAQQNVSKASVASVSIPSQPNKQNQSSNHIKLDSFFSSSKRIVSIANQQQPSAKAEQKSIKQPMISLGSFPKIGNQQNQSNMGSIFTKQIQSSTNSNVRKIEMKASIKKSLGVKQSFSRAVNGENFQFDLDF